MSILSHRARHWRSAGCVAVLAFAARLSIPAQQRPTLEPKNWTAAEDHRKMMEQLGIKALRPGPSGNEQAPNHANYDETQGESVSESARRPDAEERPESDDARNSGRERRPEIVEDFEREVLGRVPQDVPKVTWTVTATDTGTIGGTPVVGKQLVGHVDNSSLPVDHRRHLR